MNGRWTAIGLSIVTVILAIGTMPDAAMARHLAAPSNVMCHLMDIDMDMVGDTIAVSWDTLDGAKKYSVAVVAGYDTDGDSVPDTFKEFDFGTGDRTDGGAASDPNLSIPLSALVVDVNEDGQADTPVTILVSVKGLDPGRGKGRQNHPFSSTCMVS